MYDLLRSLMFKLPAETSHDLALDMIGAAGRLRLADKLVRPVPAQPVEVMVEVGTVTPRPQPGNPKPRLFRLAEHEAIINRFGFNNLGVDAMLDRLAATRYRGVLGVNIGKNAVTPVENAVDDYCTGYDPRRSPAGCWDLA